MLYYIEVRSWLICEGKSSVSIWNYVFLLNIIIKFKVSLHSFFVVSGYQKIYGLQVNINWRSNAIILAVSWNLRSHVLTVRKSSFSLFLKDMFWWCQKSSMSRMVLTCSTQNLRNRNKEDLVESTGVILAKYSPKVKLENFYNSRVSELS